MTSPSSTRPVAVYGAGGHTGRVSTFTLLPQVAATVTYRYATMSPGTFV